MNQKEREILNDMIKKTLSMKPSEPVYTDNGPFAAVIVVMVVLYGAYVVWLYSDANPMNHRQKQKQRQVDK